MADQFSHAAEWAINILKNVESKFPHSPQLAPTTLGASILIMTPLSLFHELRFTLTDSLPFYIHGIKIFLVYECCFFSDYSSDPGLPC
jgi:hypothetical protein